MPIPCRRVLLGSYEVSELTTVCESEGFSSFIIQTCRCILLDLSVKNIFQLTTNTLGGGGYNLQV